ncbi:1,4-alpha-glucan branching protein GlgB [Thalassorhabdus alkalitolerans]|uniref:1,4-alpha-glucan branching enzyme GlgB n=1 Tax=Thalassorhabdus alkalitolerans TaxID=2282697 RepID=A0ABW0YUK5_9BACI
MDNLGISEHDLYLFHQGTFFQSYETFGCHHLVLNGESGYRFVVWAPHAKQVSVVGEFNYWNGDDYPLHRINDQGVWAGFFTSIEAGTSYKYKITTSYDETLLKADPYAFTSEVRPATASVAPAPSTYKWSDQEWISEREKQAPYDSPLLVYEVHLGTWKRKDDGTLYSYRELAETLVPYVKDMGFTHIELLPLAEHPYDRSWGYQITGYFSVTSRFGSPDDFRYFVDTCHKHQIGVIMDWVPGHFCKDSHGLRLFDGGPVFEYEDSRKAEKLSWGTLTFDFGKPEIQSFLISNAVFWMKEFHIDGLRVDAVANMLYLNFDKHDGEEKIYNTYGGEENLEAIAFLRKLNETVFKYQPHALMMAEESTSWPLVSSPTHVGGLGFNFKWNMGWMNDMLEYMEMDPVHRKWNHSLITFSLMYAFSENYILPLSHDEVVHGKRSLLNKMPGDQWQQFAQLRLLYGYMMTHPGKKLLFMGGELGQYDEWKDLDDLDWNLLDYPLHNKVHRYVKELNHFYLEEKALFEKDHEGEGFFWINANDYEQSIISFVRKGFDPEDELLIVCNFTPVVRYDYRVGVPKPGTYKEIFNSDSEAFGGSGQTSSAPHFTVPEHWNGQDQYISLKIPPLAITVYRRLPEGEQAREEEQ